MLGPTLLLGAPTRLAIGTGLFQVIFTGGLGAFLYARSGHVDLVMAVIMLAAASVGSRLGVAATRVVTPGRIRLLFSFTLLGGTLAVALKQIAEGRPGLGYLTVVSEVVILASAGSICLVLVAASLGKGSQPPH
ncbi:MAG: hypothetical protein EXR46_07235 [Dehalococcoidia bacterium]|nr:hypothetical protein [Dehalococcoidia bacterium]